MSSKVLRDGVWLPALCLLLAACSSGGGNSGNGDSVDTTTPTATVTLTPGTLTAPDPALIPVDTVFTIHFSESMDTTLGTWQLGGDLASESTGGVWGMTNTQNDTLTISPSGTWFASPGRTLTLDAHDLAGNALATLNLAYNVYRGAVYYIDTTRPDDTGDGLSPTSAKKFIHSTVAAAATPSTLLVRAGDYRLSNQLGTHVVLREGVSLYGGYNGNFSARDPAANITTIEDRSTTGGTSAAPQVAIFADGSGIPITADTVVDGFTILGSTQGADYTSAMLLANDASPTVQHNRINGGTSATGAIGVYNLAASPMLQYNTINAGSSGNFAIAIRNDNASAIIRANTISGGSGAGPGTWAILTTGSGSLVIDNNLIHGGNGGVSFGIESSSSATIRNNTLSGGEGTSSAAIKIDSPGFPPAQAPVIDNNSIFTRSGANGFCLYETFDATVTSSPGTLRHNDFFNCNVLYFDQEGGCTGNGDGDGDARTCSIDEINALADISGGVNNNIALDPLLIDIDGADDDINTLADNNWHLSLFTPTGILQGGLNGSDQGWAFTQDKDGMARPVSGNPWSIGAYEAGVFDHADYINNYTCATSGCHDSVTPGITGKSLTHADTTDVCEACHVTTAWGPAITPFDHGQVVTPDCADCHDGSNPNISGKSPTHVDTTDTCQACHNTIGWTPLLTIIDHSQVLTTVCMECHQGTIASGKGTTHLVTNQDCGTCHTTSSWLNIPP